MSHKDSKLFRCLIHRRQKAWLVIENMQALCLLPFPPVPMIIPVRPGTIPHRHESFEDSAKRAMKEAQDTIKDENIREEESITYALSPSK